MASRTAARAFSSHTSPRSLKATYITYVRPGAARGRDGVLPAFLGPPAPVCELISRRMRAGDYRFTQYRQLLVSKGAGKYPRVLSIPTARDRITLKALAGVLLEVFPDTKSSLPQDKVERVREALGLEMFDSFVRIDVREFYPSVKHDQIERSLRLKIRKPEIIKIVLDAISTPTVADGGRRLPGAVRVPCGVPQGLAISNLLAELAIAPVDRKMRADVRCSYFRFVDDILLFCDSTDSSALHDEVVTHLAEVGLTCHEPVAGSSKTALGSIAEGFDYLGYVFKGGRIGVRSSSVSRVESALARTFTAYNKQAAVAATSEAQRLALTRCLWFVNLTITGCIYKKSARGWLPYFRQMNDLTVLKKLDLDVQAFQVRFGLPAHVKPKRFMRAYWALRHRETHATSYVPNSDEFGIEAKREHLSMIEGDDSVARLSDYEVGLHWSRVLDRAVKELERDIGSLS